MEVAEKNLAFFEGLAPPVGLAAAAACLSQPEPDVNAADTNTSLAKVAEAAAESEVPLNLAERALELLALDEAGREAMVAYVKETLKEREKVKSSSCQYLAPAPICSPEGLKD